MENEVSADLALVQEDAVLMRGPPAPVGHRLTNHEATLRQFLLHLVSNSLIRYAYLDMGQSTSEQGQRTLPI
jgi:hypothetical protein